MKIIKLPNKILSIGRLVSVINYQRSLFFCFILSIAVSCDAPSDNGLDGNILPATSEPKSFCVTLDNIEVQGDFEGSQGIKLFGVADEGGPEPELYGRVCGVASEDEYITKGDISVQEQTQNCKDFWVHKDHEPFGSPILPFESIAMVVKKILPDLVEILPPGDLVDSYRWSDAPKFLSLFDEDECPALAELMKDPIDTDAPAKLGLLDILRATASDFVSENSCVMKTIQSISDKAKAEESLEPSWNMGKNPIGTRHTITVKDKHNHRMLIVVLPILDDDKFLFPVVPFEATVADTLLYPKSGFTPIDEGGTSKKDEIPAILHVRDSDFPNSNRHSSIKRSIVLAPGEGGNSEDYAGTVTLNFTIAPEACESEIAFSPNPPWGPDGAAPPSPKYKLTINNGLAPSSGVIKDVTGNIHCGTDASTSYNKCEHDFKKHSKVLLTATEKSDSHIIGNWDGDVDGCNAYSRECSIDMGENPKSVTKNFRNFDSTQMHTLTVTKPSNGYIEIRGTGGGSLDATGVFCGHESGQNHCVFNLNEGTTVMLTAVAAAGSVIGSWEDDCRGIDRECRIERINEAKEVTKNFKKIEELEDILPEYCVTLKRLKKKILTKFDKKKLIRYDDAGNIKYKSNGDIWYYPSSSTNPRPEPYGYVCAVRSNQLSTASSNIDEFLNHCQMLWHRKDNNPLSGIDNNYEIITWAVPDATPYSFLTSSLRVHDLYNYSEGVDDNDLLPTDFFSSQSVNKSVTLTGFLSNDEISLVFLPILDDDDVIDDGADDLFVPSFTNANTSSNYPAIFHIKQSSIPTTKLRKSLEFELSNPDEDNDLDGVLTFEFQIERDACD